MTIEESKDLTSLSLDELIGNLKVHEIIIMKDSKIVKAKVERKSLSLKAKKESSDEECSTFGSEDEYYTMATFQRSRDDKNAKSNRKCFRCGDPNYHIGESPKPPKDKNQRAFVGGFGSNSGEEDDENVKNKMCLVAQASSYSQYSKAYIILNKQTRKVEESLNVTFDETPPPSKTSPLVDDDLDEEKAIKITEKKNLENDIVDETLEIDKIGIDYDETYATVDRLESIRILLAYACALHFKLFQMNAKSAFPNGFINEEKQTALAISTTEAEYVSAKKSSQQVIWMKQALWMKQARIDCDVQLDDVLIMCDNKDAINLSKNLLAFDHYLSHDRAMHPLAPYYELKTRSDHGKKRPRESNTSFSSSSSTTQNHPSISLPLDATGDKNDDESSHSHFSSPS
nr:putative LRR receptor-like protein kinase [Tanacetum cinerariifolium]